ncbi:hypothetical protein [Anaerotignum lactatifermentans]|uniref:hypothetical protein n=1 Tax=Anaerotignum lactatifermentans TaxID=160404 RepID=UPI0026720EEA|nr:hypothetical protein [Anaerotignum lactatifermentans]
MKNIRNWMLFAMVLLFFDVHIGIVNLLPNWAAYLILAYCAKKMMAEKGGLTAALGICAAVLQIIFFFFQTDNALLTWLFSGIFWTMEMLLFYGLATGILQLQEKEGLWIRRKILLMLYAISIVACGMTLNIRPMFIVSGIIIICARLYFLFAIWHLIPKEEKAEPEEENT